MCKGFMRISREKISEFEWLSNPNTFYVFMRLLFKANFKDGKWEGVEVKRGQLITGRKTLSEELNLSEQQIRTCLDKLSKTGYITIKTTNKFSIVTICDYDSWQNDSETNNQQLNQQITNNQPTNNQQITTIEINNNKDNKENNNIISAELSNSAVPKQRRKPIYSSLVGKCREKFEEFYKSVIGEDYYYSGADGNNMKLLLAKIRNSRENRNMAIDDGSMISAFVSFLGYVKKNEWLLANLSVKNINSKYNEIVASNSNKQSGVKVGAVLRDSKDRFKNIETL